MPGSAPLPAPQPFPSSGRRRRRRRRLPHVLATLALLVAPIGVAAAAYLGLAGKEDGGGSPAPPLAAGTSPARELVEQTAPREPSEPGPLVEGEPVPAIPLAGVDAFHVRLRKPPRAALVFDLDSGDVLWRRRPLRVLPMASLTKIMTALVVAQETRPDEPVGITKAALVFDLDSGDVLWRRRPLRVLPMASLTKIMTALVVAQETRPDEPVRITKAALNYTGSGVGMLPKGKRVRLETLMNGLLLVSGNDAAIALAVHVSGSERRFVRLMNRRAREWGLDCTRFASSHGLEKGNHSCARDLAVMTRMAMARERIRRVARRRQVAFRFPIKGRKLYLTGHNPLMRLGYPGAVGLKTGYTSEAGRCFVGVARRGGRRMGVVLLNSRDPSRHAPILLDKAFERVQAR